MVMESVGRIDHVSGNMSVEMLGVMETMRVTQPVPLARVPPGGLGTSSRFAVQAGDWNERGGVRNSLQWEIDKEIDIALLQNFFMGSPAAPTLLGSCSMASTSLPPARRPKHLV